jgi:hypothetical protein
MFTQDPTDHTSIATMLETVTNLVTDSVDALSTNVNTITTNINTQISNMRTLKAALKSELEYATTINRCRHIYDDKYITFPTITPDTKELQIDIHGMNSSSGQSMIQFNEVEKYNLKHPGSIKIFAPQVINAGLEELQICGDAIYAQICPHLDTITRLNIKIVILGISNGGRVGLYLYATIFVSHPTAELYLSTLGSPIQGTYLADLAEKSCAYKMTKYKSCPEVLSELKPSNSIYRQILERCQKDPKFQSRTRFYVSKRDVLIYPFTCGILEGHNNQIVDDVIHNGLVLKYAKEQIQWCISLIDS